jgi:hypothetical protein
MFSRRRLVDAADHPQTEGAALRLSGGHLALCFISRVIAILGRLAAVFRIFGVTLWQVVFAVADIYLPHVIFCLDRTSTRDYKAMSEPRPWSSEALLIGYDHAA